MTRELCFYMHICMCLYVRPPTPRKHVFLILAGQHAMIPGGNWARLNEADSDTTALANTIKECFSKGRVGCSWWLSPEYQYL